MSYLENPSVSPGGNPASRPVERGLALIAVLVALSILLALAAPFLISMGHGEQASRAQADELQVDWASGSARDMLLAAAARSESSVDPTPLSDGLDEFPAHLEVSEALGALTENGRQPLQGEVWDVQRKIDVNTASPLLLANLLSLSARLQKEHDPEATELSVDDASAFLDSGFLICDREVIRYDGKSGNTFTGLQRGVMQELGYAPADDHTLPDGALVLDLRTIGAVTLPFAGDPTRRTPYGSAGELARIEALGYPGFTASELDLLEENCTAVSMLENSTTWGQPERVFEILDDEQQKPRILVVRSVAALGGGAVVRLRALDSDRREYALVWAAADPDSDAAGTINLPRRRYVHLLTPLTEDFEPLETVIEPLVPHPINVNTASRAVLAAVMAHIRQRPGSRTSGGHGETRVLPPYIGRGRALELADQIITLRTPAGDAFAGLPDEQVPRPFEGWEDFVTRFLEPLFAQSTGQQRTMQLVQLYDVLQVGRPGGADMGTASLCFHSAPLVGYRASAVRQKASGVESARIEREGFALAVPGRSLFWGGATQATLEELTRLDRRTPWWLSYPINTAATVAVDRGTEPAVRTYAHLLATAFPDAGFGQARFPDREGTEGGVRPSPSLTMFGYPNAAYQHESFMTSLHPEGRDVVKEGTYEVGNSGPRSKAVGEGGGGARDHSKIYFPLTTSGGLTSRHAISFWFRLEDTAPQAIYDLAVAGEGNPERNRISLQIKDDALVFEVLDEAGLDPEPSRSPAAPERSSGRWEVPLQDIDLRANTWYHVNLSATGNRPGQLTMLVDGVPRGEPELRTFLTAPIEPYEQDYNRRWLEDEDRFVSIRVESTEGFPEQGVLRIGLELFEYSIKDGSTFYCRYGDSLGGRAARAAMHEFQVSIPREENGEPREDLLKILNGRTSDAVAPDHLAASTVELYGYSVPVYPQTVLQPGVARLADSLGAFAVARVVNQQNARPIVLETNRIPIMLGQGIDETFTDALELGDPLSEKLPGNPARDEVLAAFAPSGGYALLVQRRMSFGPSELGTIAQNVEVGGVEVIRYSGRQGNRLDGIQRNVALPSIRIDQDSQGFFDNSQPHRFVTYWTLRFGGVQVDPNEMPLWYTYVVPISIPVAGPVNESSELVEWVQLYQPGGAESLTEWVRYNLVLEGSHLCRAEQRAWNQLRFALTEQTGAEAYTVGRGGSVGENPVGAQLEPWQPPYDDGIDRIGFIEDLEVQLPGIYAARRALGFRGDPFTGTTSHPQPANTQVLPVHRFEFDWSGYGISAARAGRNDRVAMVQGSRRAEGEVPAVEWHTVNWAVRHYPWDEVDEESTTGRNPNSNNERRGDWPFQLVAFKELVGAGFIGEADASRDLLNDVRLIDRMVKYPSGELPAADAEEAMVGATPHQDVRAMRGVVDEIDVTARMADPRPLDQHLEADGSQFFVRPDVVLTPAGGLVKVRPRQWADWGRLSDFPEDGGLLMIDGEILAFESYDRVSGEVRVAVNGRGLLGTEPRSHDEGAEVLFLEQVPAAILTSSLNEGDHEINVKALGGLPRHGGTLLNVTELLHYTWTRGQQTLEMPQWRDPEDQNRAARGLFRGRYGTTPAAAANGAAVIWFPCRYWDRFRERAGDPEMSCFQVTLDQGPAFFDGFGWQEEEEDSLVDLHCYVRIDRHGEFSDDPETTDGLFLLTDGQPGDRLNPLLRQGSRLEARFVNVYRNGAFDPVLFRAQSWKRAPMLRWFGLRYDGEPRILQERITAR